METRTYFEEPCSSKAGRGAEEALTGQTREGKEALAGLVKEGARGGEALTGGRGRERERHWQGE